MERLTEDSVTGETYIKQCASSCPYDGDFCGTDECPVLNAVADKLGEYERAEEQGLFVRLPCKVGDTVYKLWYYDGKPYKIQQHVIRTLSELCGIMEAKKLGKSVFLTREEAEKKLEELKNGKK
jgi:hypothetical protein